ncbi:hypothetical protein CHS0354_015742 [Potamilus streckersoni]|uniref:Uncharacterized protein n=1 Tax=Potamilus streckersoni TaxID=2493646 RepID=A0AAE0T3C2_9BIVA|nr:hypothetical protein CHS0354_015742 [Potamilus streckersoni]
MTKNRRRKDSMNVNKKNKMDKIGIGKIASRYGEIVAIMLANHMLCLQNVVVTHLREDDADNSGRGPHRKRRKKKTIGRRRKKSIGRSRIE